MTDLEANITKETESSTAAAMSLPAKLNLASPLIREWVGSRRANIRPAGVFFNSANFQVAPSASRLSKRVFKNVEYFQSNYVLVFLVLVLYCLITSPLLLIVMGAAGGACYLISLKNQENKLTIAGHEVSLAGQYSLVLLLSVPFLLLAGAGGVVFWVLGASIFLISIHAAFYNFDALDIPEEKEQLTGTIVEEV